MAKNSFKKITVAVLSAVGLSALTFGAVGCLPKSTDLTEPENIEISRSAPPADGSLPTAHTCAENLSYIIYTFDRQPQYHTYSYGVTAASIATQTTRNFRDYKDGVLLNTDLTYSSMVKSGTQTCSMYNEDGEYEVYFRTSEAPEADTLPSQAAWSESAPTFFNKKAYNYTYGLLPNELFNYIVNEENIIDSEQIRVNSDGTYTQKFTLDPVASTYFYQFGMKTRGGLSGYPEFESITFSVDFDGDWQILSATMHEVSKINKGIVVTSVSDFKTQYWYGDDHFDEEHYAFYDSYFKNYIDDSGSLEQGGPAEDELVIDVTNVLSNGFSQIMNDGAQFEIALNLGANRYVGYIYLSLDLENPLETLALKVSLGKTLREQTLYLEYGNDGLAAYYGKDFALSANLSEVKAKIDELAKIIDDISAAFKKSAESTPEESVPAVQAEEDDPLTALMNSMELTADEKQAVLTLNTDDLLGLGIGINAKLIFGINNNKITFRSASVGDLSIGGEAVDINLSLRTTTAPEIVRVPSETGADLADYVADINKLLGADLIKVTAKLDGSGEKVSINALKGLRAEVNAYADVDGVTVGADAYVAYTYKGREVSAKVGVWYGYDPNENNYGKAIVSLDEFNEKPLTSPLKIKCDIKEVAEAVSTLITFGGGDGSQATEGLVSIVNGALSSDFGALLTEMYADKAQIKVGISIDDLLGMLGVNTGISFGSCTLKYARGEGDAVYGGELSANLPALGLELTVCGEGGAIAQPDDTDCLDLAYVIDDIKEIANAELLKAHISLDGSAEGVTLSALDGVNAELDVYFNAHSIALGADAEISYNYGEDKISVKLSARYADENVAVSLDEINGVTVAAKVYCNIDEITQAVTALLDYAGVQAQPFEKVNAIELSGVVSNLLAADFATLLPELYTQETGLRIALNCDELLSVLGVDLGISFGNINLAYNHGDGDVLIATAPALGLSAGINGANGTVEMPDLEGYLNLTDLVNTVKAVWEQVDGIIDNQSVSFEMVEGENFLSLDGIDVGIWGKGEVCWKAGEEYVALDLSMSISEQRVGATNEVHTDVLKFKFIYDKNADGSPLLRLALNEVGIDIYREDIESVKDGFNGIYNKVMGALGKDGGQTQPTEPENGGTTEGENGGVKFTVTDKLLGVLFGILSDDGWVDELNNLTLSTDGKSVALSYLADNAFCAELGADGKLSLYYDGAFGERFSLSGGITASATVGDLRGAINEKIANENVTMSSSKKEGSAPFVKLAYDYLFSAISAIDVSHILGSDTYTVTFNLNGDNSGVKELENVRVRAEIYVTGASEDINGNKQPKLSEANLDIDAAGVVIKLNVITERRNNNTHFYINLSQVMDIKLPDLKFKATQSSLYETFEVLFDAINNTQLISDAAKLFGLSASEAPAEPEATDKSGETEPETNGQLADKLADMITRLISFDFGSAVTATEIDNVTTAELNLDSLVKGLFDVQTGALGTVEVVINHNNHSMTTRGTNDWISLSSKLAARKDYSKFDRSEYVSIEFLPDLIGDLVKVATNDNGNLQTSFTLSGSINARVINMIDVNIDPCTLTVNIGDDGLWLSLVMHVNKAKVIGIGIPESTVGITYKNGLLTLAKGLNTATPEYKVVTFEYFMDNMLSGDELLNWLLEISGWNLFKSSLPEISSGLTTTQDVRLYEASVAKEEQEISMYSFVNALSVVIGGNQTAVFGDYGALERDLGVNDNYYGFALNAGAVTNGVLTKLNAAITRTDDGLDRVLASGALQSYVTFSASLQFKNNLTDEYQLGNTLQGGVTAPDLYEKALGIAAENGYVPDFDYFEKNPSQGYDKKFGCMSVTATSGGYSISTQYSNVLYSHTLTIVRANGEIEETSVRHGSTVYLYDNAHPVYADENKNVRVLYSAENGEVGASSVIMNGDITVYEVRRAAVTVVVHNGVEEIIVNSFVDDKVPTTVAGLETITRPTYANGTEVGDNDIIDGSVDTVHIYGTFVKTEAVVNYVKYTFSAQTMSYTASGKAAGFNDYYSTKGNTLVLENAIGGYPVTAIAANAFANTEGKAIKSVVAPENIVTVGENAFLDNVDMESAVFLAENVTFLGNDGSSKTMPFYGCSVSGNEEQTALKVYYKNISANGGNWKHFRYVSKVFSFNFYIGDNGGAVYGAGWTYVDFAVNVDTNGVTDGTLSEEAVKNILAPYFPYATAGSYEGSLIETNANKALENGIANFTVLRGGITYACSYTAEVKAEGGRTTVTFNVTYKATAEIYVQSSLAFGMYGKNIAADTLTLITVPVDGENITLPTPAHATHKFDGWTISEIDGKPCYTASWVEKATYTITVNIKKGVVDNNNVYLNGVNLGKNETPKITVYEGTVSISVDSGANRIYVTDSANTYYIEVKELSLKGFKYVESGNLRSVTTDAGDRTINGDTTITVSY